MGLGGEGCSFYHFCHDLPAASIISHPRFAPSFSVRASQNPGRSVFSAAHRRKKSSCCYYSPQQRNSNFATRPKHFQHSPWLTSGFCSPQPLETLLRTLRSLASPKTGRKRAIISLSRWDRCCDPLDVLAKKFGLLWKRPLAAHYQDQDDLDLCCFAATAPERSALQLNSHHFRSRSDLH